MALPERYSERMLWRKAVDRNPLFVVFSDKLATKDYIRERCPDLALPRTRWVGSDADSIPDDVLGGDVYVKASHGCDFNFRIRGGVVDRRELKTVTDRWLGKRYGKRYGEWAYSRVPARLFVEDAVGDAGADLLEFQVRAGDGGFVVGSVMGKSKLPGQWAAYLDSEGGQTEGVARRSDCDFPVLVDDPRLREAYRRAVAHSLTLSKGVDYARFDFFWNGRELFGGEITTYPGAGNGEIVNPEVNEVLKTVWRLEKSDFLQRPRGLLGHVYGGALRRTLRRRAIRDGLPPL